MIDETTPPSELPQSPIEKFKAEAALADGRLIPLTKPLNDGRKIYISSQYLTIPKDGKDERIDFRYASSYEDADGMVLVDLFTDDPEEGLLTVGRLDWLKVGEGAETLGETRQFLIPQNDRERMLQKTWEDDVPFRVFEEYRGQDLGSVLIVTAMLALDAHGVKTFKPKNLVPAAESAYARFGVKPIPVTKVKDPDPTIKEVLNHPKTASVLEEFIGV